MHVVVNIFSHFLPTLFILAIIPVCSRRITGE